MVDVGVGLGGEDRSGLQCVVFACEVRFLGMLVFHQQWWGWSSEDLNGRCCLFALSNQQPLASYCSWVIPIHHVT